MPIYEYECTGCGHRFEKMLKIGADAPPCPDCTSAEVRKRISASGFILKGGGWYKDHYGLKGSDSGKSEGAKSEGGSEGAAAQSEGAKSEGAKSEGAKSEGAKSDAKSDGASAKSDSAKPESKGASKKAESAPAATPAKPSSAAAK